MTGGGLPPVRPEILSGRKTAAGFSASGGNGWNVEAGLIAASALARDVHSPKRRYG